MQAEKLFDIPDLQLLDVASDGSFSVVVSNKDNTHNLYKVIHANLTWQPLTKGEDRVVTGVLSPDNSYVIFPRAKGGSEKPNLYKVSVVAGEPELVAELKGIRISVLKFTMDGSKLLFSGNDSQKMALWVLDVKSGEVKAIYESNIPGRLGPINSQVEFLAWSEMTFGNPQASIIKVIDYGSGDIVDEISINDQSEDYPHKWSPDGNKLLFQSKMVGYTELYVWDRQTGEKTTLQASELGLGYSFPSTLWLASGEEVLYSVKKAGRTNLYRELVDRTAKPIIVPTEDGWVDTILLAKEKPNTLFMKWSNLSTPSKIVQMNLETMETKVLASIMPLTIDFKLIRPQFIRYETFDGRKIPAYVVEPPSETALPGNPSIILVHGGPAWEFADNWDTMGIIIQLYATAGFTVLCPNIRGSTGYGKEFLDLNIGDLGGGDLQDVLYGKRYLMQRNPSSPIFLTGASYGGFMTFLIMTKHPLEFEAGAAVVGIPDWEAVHRLGDLAFKRLTEKYFEGSPSEKEELYRDRSAYYFIEELQKPMLIVHRENDSRCPIDPIYTFYGKAKALGKEVELIVQRNTGHGPQRMFDLKEQYGRILQFFLTHLGK